MLSFSREIIIHPCDRCSSLRRKTVGNYPACVTVTELLIRSEKTSGRMSLFTSQNPYSVPEKKEIQSYLQYHGICFT